jgi:hypothetical protein
VHVGDNGEVNLPYTQAKQVLDCLKKLAIGRDLPDAEACIRFDKATRFGRDMEPYQKLLARAVASVVGKKEERAVASLFSPGGTHAMKGEFAGMIWTLDFGSLSEPKMPAGRGSGRSPRSMKGFRSIDASKRSARISGKACPRSYQCTRSTFIPR